MNRDYQPWPEIPVLNAWITKAVKPHMIVWERNPYYFKVDSAGNQLPYIDEKFSVVAGTRELYTMKVISGQVDGDYGGLDLDQYSLLKGNEEKGNYHAWTGYGGWGSQCALAFNQTYDDEDPVLAKILRDIRFRRALSVAINREEINESIFYGFATPRQGVINPDAEFYKEEFAEAYTEYDPNKANSLLDEAGLNKWDKDHKRRLRPDGKTLTIVLTLWPNLPNAIAVCELVKEYWEAVGVKTILNSVERSYLWDMQSAYKHQVWEWIADGTTQAWFYRSFYPPLTNVAFAKWWLWFTTDGKEGVEPSEEAKRLLSLTKKVSITTGEERKAVAEEIWRIWTQNLWAIGTVGLVPKPCMANNDLGNVDVKARPDSHDWGGIRNQWAEFWYWKK
jgi:peptide/nickel transport system substrate-binding protein